MVVKTTPLRPNGTISHTADNLKVEIAITIVLNALATRIPNFVVALGHFECGGTAEGEKAVCTREMPLTSYLLLPRIETTPDSTWSIEKFFQETDLSVPQNQVTAWHLLLQIMGSLSMAPYYYHYNHLDLHGQNILIQGLHTIPKSKERTYKLRYTLSSGAELELTQVPMIAVLIDFGLSRLVVDNNGNHELVTINSRPAFNPSADVFRIIKYLWVTVRKQNASSPRFLDPLIEMVAQFTGIDQLVGPGAVHALWRPAVYQKITLTPNTVIRWIMQEHPQLPATVVSKQAYPHLDRAIAD